MKTHNRAATNHRTVTASHNQIFMTSIENLKLRAKFWSGVLLHGTSQEKSVVIPVGFATVQCIVRDKGYDNKIVVGPCRLKWEGIDIFENCATGGVQYFDTPDIPRQYFKYLADVSQGRRPLNSSMDGPDIYLPRRFGR